MPRNSNRSNRRPFRASQVVTSSASQGVLPFRRGCHEGTVDCSQPCVRCGATGEGIARPGAGFTRRVYVAADSNSPPHSLNASANPNRQSEPLPTEEVESGYLKQIVAFSAGKKRGLAVDSRPTAFTRLAARKDVSGPEFAAVREIVITHFAEVNEYNVDRLLNSFGPICAIRDWCPC